MRAVKCDYQFSLNIQCMMHKHNEFVVQINIQILTLVRLTIENCEVFPVLRIRRDLRNGLQSLSVSLFFLLTMKIRRSTYEPSNRTNIKEVREI